MTQNSTEEQEDVTGEDERRDEVLSQLSDEEKRLLREYEVTRPAQTPKKMKTKKKRKSRLKRVITAPETYAAIFAIIPFFIVVFGLSGIFAVNQIADLDEVLQLEAQEAAEYGIIDQSQAAWYETGVWVYDNAILVIVGSCAVFFVGAVMILLVAKIWRSWKSSSSSSEKSSRS